MNPTRKLFLLIPVIFCIHVSEEWFFGFPEWAQIHFGPVTTSSFFASSHIVLVLVVAASAIAGYRSKSKGLGVFLTLTVLFTLVTNGLFHVVTWFLFKEYSPGVVSSLVIYFPFSLIFGRKLLAGGLTDCKQLLTAFICGLLVSIAVIFSLFA